MLDLVISGPDMSGTGTQINDLISFFKAKEKKVRDLRGTEIDALFHAEIFKEINQSYLSLKELLAAPNISQEQKNDFLIKAVGLLSSGGTNEDLRIASCVKNEVSTFIDPDSAEVWIMEEPTKRGAGQVNRTIEQNRTKYGGSLDPLAAAYCHSIYRVDEFLRFRKVFREKNKIIIRSRSEESSCCYHIKDELIPNGITSEELLCLPGHRLAFGFPPSHFFIVCAPLDWTKDDYLALKAARSGGRRIDDHEAFAEYQLLINRRYASSFLEEIYEQAGKIYNVIPPKIYRFNIYDTKEEIRDKMRAVIQTII